ncbi:calcium/sodium antiporter [Candidatus Poribacteria bacterium]|nr:calcium/sodium antiporter [Candidatus Poribacteria bacterium]
MLGQRYSYLTFNVVWIILLKCVTAEFTLKSKFEQRYIYNVYLEIIMSKTALDLVLFAVAVALISKGADWFTEASVKIAEATHIPKVIIGATIVSIATTLPEFSVSAIATIQNHTDMAIGNAIGSCICNIGLILGTCTIARASITDKKLLTQQGGFMLAAAIIIALLTFTGGIPRWGGVILIIGLACYMYYSVRTAKSRRSKALIEQAVEEESKDFPSKPTLRNQIIWFLIGAACVVAGSRLLVYTGIKIAEMLGVPEMIISLTLVALGTSLPEYVTALTATIKGHQELSVGNIIGADMLNIFWVLGGCSLIRPLPLNSENSFLGLPQTQSLDIPVMFLLMILMLAFGFSEGKLRRWQGGILFLIYVVYIIILFTVVG